MSVHLHTDSDDQHGAAHKAENIHYLVLTPPDLGAQARRQSSPCARWPFGACGPAGAALAGLSPPQLGGQGGDGMGGLSTGELCSTRGAGVQDGARPREPADEEMATEMMEGGVRGC